MCRMIAATGRVEMAPLMEALRVMALNRNTAYDHELRSKGDALHHDCGWGTAYRGGDDLIRWRSASPCYEDPAFDALAGIETDLVILHARRTVARDTIAEANSPPFLTSWKDETWAFCHNGEVRDRSQLSYDAAFAPEGTIDSEPLFFHILTRLDAARSEDSLPEILGGITDFTSVNCFLARPRSVLAAARMDPATPRPAYYALWQGRGRGFSVVSSEVVDGLDVAWEAIPDGGAVTLSL